jgi:2-oxoglutarate ferredoxin oxidoreductase subunit alpha
VCAWYPITPSSSVAEAFQRHCARYASTADKKNRFAIIQAEDELASIGMVIGAAGTARAPSRRRRARHLADAGVPRLAYFAEIPAVLVDVQRAGPRPACRRARSNATCSAAPMRRTATPSTCCCSRGPGEAFEMTAQAFDLADRCRRRSS